MVWKALGCDKFYYFITVIVPANGGLLKSIKKWLRMQTPKSGTLVGVDSWGNKYYENEYYCFMKDRWVEYADYLYLNFDGSQVAPEWASWLNHRNNPPHLQMMPQAKYKWMPKYHWENMTGSGYQYVPYSTVNQKIHAWIPPSASSKA